MKHCKWCGEKTQDRVADECDSCWEMRSRIEEKTGLAEIMLSERKRKSERKEPPFEPKYYSGLNWREAEKLVGKVVEFSDNGEDWISDKLNKAHDPAPALGFRAFQNYGSRSWHFIRTCPETHAHPTITLTVNGREWVLPMPETEAPKCGQTVYIWELTEVLSGIEWRSHMADREWLLNGQVFKKHKYAQAWADWWKNTVMAAVKEAR